jgi:hypothetical protein
LSDAAVVLLELNLEAGAFTAFHKADVPFSGSQEEYKSATLLLLYYLMNRNVDI